MYYIFNKTLFTIIVAVVVEALVVIVEVVGVITILVDFVVVVVVLEVVVITVLVVGVVKYFGSGYWAGESRWGNCVKYMEKKSLWHIMYNISLKYLR